MAPDAARVATRAADAPRMIRSSALGARVAATGTADLFVFEQRWVIKLFRPHIAFGAIVEQHRLARLLHASGLQVPYARSQLVESLDEGRLGIVFERIDGATVSDVLARSPGGLFTQARLLAYEHHRLHANAAPQGLPSFRERLRSKIVHQERFDVRQRARLLTLLDRLPDGHVLCHGDYHWGNVMLAAGRSVLIDWSDASHGVPACDAARAWVLCSLPDYDRRTLVRAYARVFAASYLRSYARLAGVCRRELRAWCVVNAAARVQEDIPEADRACAVRYVRRHLRASAYRLS